MINFICGSNQPFHIWWLGYPWASHQIRKFPGCACAGNAENVFPAIDFTGKSRHASRHGVTHVSWCMSGSLTRGGGENVPGISRRMRNPQFLRIWQEAHYGRFKGCWQFAVHIFTCGASRSVSWPMSILKSRDSGACAWNWIHKIRN